MLIYLPMSARVLTPGHIKVIEHLTKQGTLIVGLLTAKAMKGYKKEVVPFKDRKFILENLKFNFKVVPQNSLNPYKNLIKYQCNYIASGDGWEPAELDAIREAGVNILDVKLDGEKEKQYSASKILNLGT